MLRVQQKLRFILQTAVVKGTCYLTLRTPLFALLGKGRAIGDEITPVSLLIAFYSLLLQRKMSKYFLLKHKMVQMMKIIHLGCGAGLLYFGN